MSTSYEAFLRRKAAFGSACGLTVDADEIHPVLKPHQHLVATVAFDGEPITVLVKPSNLGDALSCVASSQVSLSFGGNPGKPFLVRPAGDDGAVVDGYRHVLMPMNPRPGADG